MVIKILATPFSLGYISQMAATTFGVPVARISNALGVFIAPTLSGVRSAMDAFTDELDELRAKGETVFFQSIVDPQSRQNSSYAYPIAMFTYWAFDPAQLNCEVLQDVLYLIYWAWTNPQAAQTAIEMGSSPISTKASSSLVAAVRRLECAEARNPGVGGADSDELVESLRIKRTSVLDAVMYQFNSSTIGTGASTPYVTSAPTARKPLPSPA
jgi:hypothetical protein